MDHSLLELLACPGCTESPLELATFDADGGDVITGVLVCGACHVWYPVVDGVPVMVVFPTPLHERFVRAHRRRLDDIGGSYAKQIPRIGDASVQETFTAEWDRSGDTELAFIFSADDAIAMNRDVFLAPLTRHEGEQPKRILDVGCGSGIDIVAHRSLFPEAEIVGIDLSLTLLASAKQWKADPLVHLVIASLFDPPFRRAQFDLVFSDGVLHHTHSTREAFESIAPLTRPGGHLFVWLYGRDDLSRVHGRRHMAAKGTVALETVLRPLVSRAPTSVRNMFFAAATRAAHPLLQPRMLHADRWGPANTEHHLRDWLSPRYAHRHGYNEVIDWFEDCGYEVAAVQSPAAFRRLFNEPRLGVGVLARKLPERSS